MVIRNALGKGHGGRAQNLHPRAVFAAGRGRQPHGVYVKQGKVVVVLDVVHHLVGLGGVAHTAQVTQIERRIPVRLEREVADGARQRALDQVTLVAQVVQRPCRTAGVGVIKHPVDKALIFDQGVTTVAAAPTAHRIAHFVAKGPNAVTGHVALGRLLKARTIANAAKVPTLPQQLHIAPSGDSHLGLQIFHHRTRLKAHQVKTKGTDFVVPCPSADGINHQLAHHQVLGSGVLAAGVFEDAAVVVQAVVVARHHAVQHGGSAQARSTGVVVDHVHTDAQTSL